MAKRKQSKGSRGSNKNLTEEVLTKFQQRQDVIALSSGLLYRIIEDAEGAQPSMQDRVKVHQRIKLGDGSVIDDTYKKGLPEEYAVSEAIEGLQEGFLLKANWTCRAIAFELATMVALAEIFSLRDRMR